MDAFGVVPVGDEFEEASGDEVFRSESLIFCDEVEEVDAEDDHVSNVLALESS